MPGECWLYVTFQGEFRIEPMPLAGTTRFAVLWENELLGCYETPAVAAGRLARSLVCRPRCGLDLRHLDLPPALSDWAYVPACSAPYPVGARHDDGPWAAGSSSAEFDAETRTASTELSGHHLVASSLPDPASGGQRSRDVSP